MDDSRNDSDYRCVRAQGMTILAESDPTILYVASEYQYSTIVMSVMQLKRIGI